MPQNIKPVILRGENGQEKAPRHFLQPYSGVLILAVKAKPLRGAREARSLDHCGERVEGGGNIPPYVTRKG